MKENRRNFFKKVTLGAVGVGLSNGINAMSAKSYSNIIGSNDRINLAIQGLGRRCSAFIPPIANKKNNVRLLYLCDVKKSQQEKAAIEFSKHLDYKPKLEIKDLSGLLNEF